MAGYTNSTDFPGTSGGAQASNRGYADAFVARLNSSLTQILQATYLGGRGRDEAEALAIHPTTGDVYVAGYTLSDDFPRTSGGAQVSYGGWHDAFVARLNSSLTQILQATYLGGRGTDAAYALAIHPTTGEVYVAGETYSTNFPGTSGGAQASNRGYADAFVARLNSNLTQILQATYLGGSDYDWVYALAIHPTTGEVYVAGWTGSTYFPGTFGGAQSSYGGGQYDAFVARLNSGLTQIIQSTYLGGRGRDEAKALAIHPTTGDVYVAGFTNSTDFPGTSGGAQVSHRGGFRDAFVARLSADLRTLRQSTYLGGSDWDEAYTLAVHPTTGDVYVAGNTSSDDFPGTSGGAQTGSGGLIDAFVARLNSGLTQILQATYLGGSDSDYAHNLAIHPTTGEVYVAGETKSTNFPGTSGGAQTSYGRGDKDAFVARLTTNLAATGGSEGGGGSGGGRRIRKK